MPVVDTSVWIDFLRGTDSPERRMLHALIEKDEEIALTGIVFTEILQGIKEDRDFQVTKNYLSVFPLIEPTGLNTYAEASRIFRQCRSKDKTVRSTIDCIIAAICLENNLSVLHKDRDYDIIRECTGLKVITADNYQEADVV